MSFAECERLELEAGREGSYIKSWPFISPGAVPVAVTTGVSQSPSLTAAATSQSTAAAQPVAMR